ncbi:hypothetical protein ECEPECA14_1042 [Escherichia coli EPECa14]|nr:hypothetical protein ECEPECA14_1042 [Escherichia coli EPECa14]
MIWQPEFTDKTLSRKTGAVQTSLTKKTQKLCALIILTMPLSAAQT